MHHSSDLAGERAGELAGGVADGLARTPVAGEGTAPGVVRLPVAITPSWDPYQVWLTRVKEPREQNARTRAQDRRVIEPAVAADPSDTARLRILSPAP